MISLDLGLMSESAFPSKSRGGKKELASERRGLEVEVGYGRRIAKEKEECHES